MIKSKLFFLTLFFSTDIIATDSLKNIIKFHLFDKDTGKEHFAANK